MKPRKLFVAGATGATGKVLVPLAQRAGLAVVRHLRPKSAGQAGADDAVLDLGDGPALARALTGCTTVVQLIGTVRARFNQGDTYQTSDIGTTRQLLEGARAAGIDHFLLLSSVGAGRPIGAYLKAKAEAERLVRESGLPFTVFRPSALEGGERKALPGLRAVTGWLGLTQVAPIRLEELAGAMVKVASERAPLGEVLVGISLWACVPSHR